LLAYDPLAGCYILHDLLRDVARQRCDPTHAVQSGERHGRFFCSEAAAVLVDYRYGGAAAIAALAHFDAMRPHIDAGWRWAREHTPASDTLLVDYYFATNSYRRLRYDDTEAEVHQEYQAATRIGNQYAASITMSMLGDLARFRKDFMRARTCYQESIALSQAAPYPLGEAINLGKIGLLYRSMGQPEQGLPYLQQRITLCRGFVTDQRGQRTLVAALIDLGGVSHQCAELAAALSAYEEAHQVAKTIGHSLGQCIAAIGLTHVLMAGGAFHDALQYAMEAGEIADALQAQAERAEVQELLEDIRTVLDARA
jgi:tetratricopeptide (TPR) repeat protein